MRKNFKKEKGITLIALVVTIVVLLILAGVSISMLTGENGIISQAQNAKKETEQARVEELVKLAVNSLMGKNLGDKNKITTEMIAEEVNKMEKREDVYAEGNKIIFPKEKKEVEVDFEKIPELPKEEIEPGERVNKTEKDNYTDTNGDKATIPEGFTVSGIESEQKISEGLVIYDIPEGEIVDWTSPEVQTKYNQFVWIPVKDKNEYQKDFSYPSFYKEVLPNTPENSTLTDTGYLPEGIQPEIDEATNNEKAETEAVLKYNGFYIGRYEAGKEDIDGIEILASKQDLTVWTNISADESKTKAKTMYNNNIVKSALCSGIQWDMIMHFVNGKEDGEGKEFYVTVIDKTRHTGSKTTSGQNENDRVQNIYDLEGNCFEFIAEKNNAHESYPVVGRGGKYIYSANDSASLRHYGFGYAHNVDTFRTTLYIM